MPSVDVELRDDDVDPFMVTTLPRLTLTRPTALDVVPGVPVARGLEKKSEFCHPMQRLQLRMHHPRRRVHRAVRQTTDSSTKCTEDTTEHAKTVFKTTAPVVTTTNASTTPRTDPVQDAGSMYPTIPELPRRIRSARNQLTDSARMRLSMAGLEVISQGSAVSQSPAVRYSSFRPSASHQGTQVTMLINPKRIADQISVMGTTSQTMEPSPSPMEETEAVQVVHTSRSHIAGDVFGRHRDLLLKGEDEQAMAGYFMAQLRHKPAAYTHLESILFPPAPPSVIFIDCP